MTKKKESSKPKERFMNLKKYENQIEQLKVWLDEFVREKYTL